MHKGFKCFDISTGRIYRSRDVIFYMNIFPFSMLNPHARARLQSEILLLPSSLHSVDNMDVPCANFPNHDNPETSVVDGVQIAVFSGTEINSDSALEEAGDLSVPFPLVPRRERRLHTWRHSGRNSCPTPRRTPHHPCHLHLL
jgi:hypothetical protein